MITVVNNRDTITNKLQLTIKNNHDTITNNHDTSGIHVIIITEEMYGVIWSVERV